MVTESHTSMVNDSFPNIEAEVCDVFNATRVALDYISVLVIAGLENEEANTATYILHDAANRAAILKEKFYVAMGEHRDSMKQH